MNLPQWQKASFAFKNIWAEYLRALIASKSGDPSLPFPVSIDESATPVFVEFELLGVTAFARFRHSDRLGFIEYGVVQSTELFPGSPRHVPSFFFSFNDKGATPEESGGLNIRDGRAAYTYHLAAVEGLLSKWFTAPMGLDVVSVIGDFSHRQIYFALSHRVNFDTPATGHPWLSLLMTFEDPKAMWAFDDYACTEFITFGKTTATVTAYESEVGFTTQWKCDCGDARKTMFQHEDLSGAIALAMAGHAKHCRFRHWI